MERGGSPASRAGRLILTVTSRGSDRLRLRVEQFAPVLGSLERNLATVAAAQEDARAGQVDLLVTPELSLTGYDLRDRTAAVAVDLAAPSFPELAAGPDLILGVVERDASFIVYNSAVHLRAGAVLHRHRKIYLPTYGMFDEGRYFGRGTTARAYDSDEGWRLGLLVCEDLWHPALVYLLAMAGAHLVIVQTAAAGRGAWSGRGAEGQLGRFASWEAWEHLACAAAVAYGVYVVLANRVGVEGSCVFAGGSVVVGPDGSVVGRAHDRDEDRLTLDLSLASVAAARSPYAHLRDEDPHLLRRELDRLLRPT